MMDDAHLVERWTEHGGMRDLAAESAAHAGLVDARDRIVAQRIRAVPERERRAPIEAHARLVASAHVGVHAEPWHFDARTGLEASRDLGLHATLPLELALGTGDDHLEASRSGGHRVLHCPERVTDLVGIDHLDPGDTEALDGLGDRHLHIVAARVLP